MLASKPLALGIVALLAGATMFAWSATWFMIELAPGASLDSAVPVGGDAAAPALVPLSLAALALVGALAIAAPIVRVVLAGILALLGAGISATGALAIARPDRAIASSVTTVTGLDGDRAIDSAVAMVATTPWPAVTITLGVLVIASAVILALTTRRWPGASRRYDGRDAAGGTATTAQTPASAVSDWDSLSAGDDPTGSTGPR